MRKLLALFFLCAACAQSPSGPVNQGKFSTGQISMGYWATVKVWYAGTASTYSPVFLVFVDTDRADGQWTEASFISLDKQRHSFAGADSILVTPISR